MAGVCPEQGAWAGRSLSPARHQLSNRLPSNILKEVHGAILPPALFTPQCRGHPRGAEVTDALAPALQAPVKPTDPNHEALGAATLPITPSSLLRRRRRNRP